MNMQVQGTVDSVDQASQNNVTPTSVDSDDHQANDAFGDIVDNDAQGSSHTVNSLGTTDTVNSLGTTDTVNSLDDDSDVEQASIGIYECLRQADVGGNGNKGEGNNHIDSEQEWGTFVNAMHDNGIIDEGVANELLTQGYESFDANNSGRTGIEEFMGSDFVKDNNITETKASIPSDFNFDSYLGHVEAEGAQPSPDNFAEYMHENHGDFLPESMNGNEYWNDFYEGIFSQVGSGYLGITSDRWNSFTEGLAKGSEFGEDISVNKPADTQTEEAGATPAEQGAATENAE